MVMIFAMLSKWMHDFDVKTLLPFQLNQNTLLPLWFCVCAGRISFMLQSQKC